MLPHNKFVLLRFKQCSGCLEHNSADRDAFYKDFLNNVVDVQNSELKLDLCCPSGVLNNVVDVQNEVYFCLNMGILGFKQCSGCLELLAFSGNKQYPIVLNNILKVQNEMRGISKECMDLVLSDILKVQNIYMAAIKAKDQMF